MLTRKEKKLRVPTVVKFLLHEKVCFNIIVHNIRVLGTLAISAITRLHKGVILKNIITDIIKND